MLYTRSYRSEIDIWRVIHIDSQLHLRRRTARRTHRYHASGCRCAKSNLRVCSVSRALLRERKWNLFKITL